MARFRPGDLRFVLHSFVFALMVGALIVSFAPYVQGRKPLSPSEIQAFAAQSRFITPEAVVEQLTSRKTPTMLVVYASWCSYCRKVMPNVQLLWEAHKIPKDQLILLSVDEELTPLAEYLLGSGLHDMTTPPLVLQLRPGQRLANALRPLGTSYDGGVPYIAFFDAQGRMQEELLGATSLRSLEEALRHLR